MTWQALTALSNTLDFSYTYMLPGGVTEWTMVTVLKTVVAAR
jgi:hypothetical protein